MNIRRKLPPFAALRAFEATARRKSLREASGELLISSSAISHQIKSLEAFIGVKLFIRSSSGLVLTKTGASYLTEVSYLLDKLEASTDKIAKTTRAESRLSIHLYDSLAQLWLVPRMREFLSDNSDLKIELITRPEIIDLANFDVNLAVQYLSGSPSSCSSERLFEEVITPVCSPEYLAEDGPVETAADLIGRRLIISADHLDEWNFWFAAQGLQLPDGMPQFVVDSRANVLHAAREGLGIAMNRRPFGDLLVQRGMLIEPLDKPVSTGESYYLCTHRRSEGLPQVKRFKAWLLTTFRKP